MMVVGYILAAIGLFLNGLIWGYIFGNRTGYEAGLKAGESGTPEKHRPASVPRPDSD